MRTIRTPKKRASFLTAIGAGNSVTAACETAGLGRTAVYAWRADDAAFAAEWDDAADQGVDLLEDEARRRAMAQSDLLLIFMLKHRRPDVFRPPRSTLLGGIDGAPPIKPEAIGKVVVYLPSNGRGDDNPANGEG
jgi:hypothetical protein